MRIIQLPFLFLFCVEEVTMADGKEYFPSGVISTSVAAL